MLGWLAQNAGGVDLSKYPTSGPLAWGALAVVLVGALSPYLAGLVKKDGGKKTDKPEPPPSPAAAVSEAADAFIKTLSMDAIADARRGREAAERKLADVEADADRRAEQANRRIVDLEAENAELRAELRIARRAQSRGEL